MATIGDDPWDWSVERVVQELCTTNRSWQPRSSSMTLSDPDSLEKALRDHEVAGSVLLIDIDDTVLKEEFGIMVLGRRAFVRSAIKDLRYKSARYKSYMRTHQSDDVVASDISRSVHDLIQVYSRQLPILQPGQHLLTAIGESTAGAGQKVSNPLDAHPVTEGDGVLAGPIAEGNYDLSDEPSNKRRKFESIVPEGDAAVQIEEFDQFVDSTRSENGVLTPASDGQRESPTKTVNVKKRKRVAPTLITSEIDPNKGRDIPTAVDDIIYNEPLNTEPGVPYIGKDGRKRLVPILQAPLETDENGDHIQQEGSGNNLTAVSKEISSAVESHNLSGRKKPSTPSESSAKSYLGKRKLCVDDLFYSGTAVGQELPDEDNITELIGAFTKDIPRGRRRYVHSMMKNFFRAEQKVLERKGKVFSAISPYSEKFTSRFQKPSFTLFYAKPDGKIYARREEVHSWPEFNTDSSPQKTQISGERTTSFNPAGPDMLEGLGSYDRWDPSFLEKYRNLSGGDKVLPLYGESDDDNEYDIATWKEIEAERGETLDRPVGPTKRPHLSNKDVESAIDEGIAALVAKWHEKTLPKRQRKAWRLWTKSRARESQREQIAAAQIDLDHIHQRIAKIRREIMNEVWTSKHQVIRQSRILELSIFSREDLAWRISVLEQRTQPEKPLIGDRSPSARSKRPTVRSDDGEGEGESIESESDPASSDDGLDDFVVPDDPIASNEEELHELNLADSEDEHDEDASMSDASISDLPVDVPTTPKRTAKSSQTAKTHGDGDTPRTDSKHKSPLSSPSPKHLKTPQIKNEKPIHSTLSKRSSNAMPEVVDLTISSDDNPVAINLITPMKPSIQRTRIKLFNRDSPFNSASPINLSDRDEDKVPEPENIPPLNDPAAIAKFSYATWMKSFDRDRLLIKVFHSIDTELRGQIFDFLELSSKNHLWEYMSSVIGAYQEKCRSVKGLDTQIFNILSYIIMFFRIYIECRFHHWREKPSDESIFNVLKGKATWFSPFYTLCRKLKSYFDHEPMTAKLPTSRAKDSISSEEEQEEDDDGNEEEDDDAGPLQPVRRRHRVITSISDDDILEEESSQKKRKKQVFEDAHARDLREQDRLRLAQQEERRKKLQANLAKSGHAGDEDRGVIIINDAATEGQGYVYAQEEIARRVKKHQIDGIRFMWNQIVSVMDEKLMQGCLLAHTMGLGKTMQVITLLVAISEAGRSTDPSISSQIPPSLKVSKTLVLCPPGLIDNWMDELLVWAPKDALGDLRKVDASLKLPARLQTVADWHEDGGVLILGFEMFRNLVQNKSTRTREAQLTEQQHEKVQKELLEGPNIIIADEAHKMKNAKSALTMAASQFRSKSRVALTGSPLANNVEEYHTMIEWVAPNYLGPIVEFRAKYVEPIETGLWLDSTPSERRKSLKMLGVLKEDLAPKVHRADMSVLRDDLPPKKEFVITVPLTEPQRKAYSLYVQSMIAGSVHPRTKSGDVTQATIWHWLNVLALLCNHPACFMAKLQERKEEARKATIGDITSSRDATDPDEAIADSMNAPIWKVGVSDELINEETKLFKKEAPNITDIDLSYKVQILCQILDASKEAGDKSLVFSQSIPTLNFLERLCKRQKRSYARLDGSTTISKRQGLTKAFNNGKTDIYLISTAAGGLGLNLFGANRVIIFDFKFNPIMEEQAVGRAYRIGQKKPTFVYRFVAGGTFEDSVHNKTIFKMQLASRVVDKKRPAAWAKKKLGDFLFEPKDVEQQDLSGFRGMDPKVLDRILETQARNPSIRSIVQSDTFERDDNDKLTAEEEKEVKQLLSDEQLKRSDPTRYRELQANRYLHDYQQAHRHVHQASLQAQSIYQQVPRNHPTTLTPTQPLDFLPTGVASRAPASSSKATEQDGRLSLPQRPASELDTQINALHHSWAASKATATKSSSSIIPGQTKAIDPRPGATAFPDKSATVRSNSPIRSSSTKLLPATPDASSSMLQSGHTRRRSSSLSAREAIIATTKRPIDTTINGMGQNGQTKSFVGQIESLIADTAKRFRDSDELPNATLVAGHFTQLSVDLEKTINQGGRDHLQRNELAKAVLETLRTNIDKFALLLTSQLSVEEFVKEVLRSLPERSSSSSSSLEDIERSVMYTAMNRQPNRQVPSLRTPVASKSSKNIHQHTRSPRRRDDARAMERVHEKRRARDEDTSKINRIPSWAQDEIKQAQNRHPRRVSHASSRDSPQLPK